MNRKSILLFFSFVCLVFAGEQTEAPLPEFSLRDLDGNQVTRESVLGKGPVIISFWATWCVPCKKEMPHLDELYKKFGEQGLQVFSISIDDQKTVSKVKPYIKRKKYEMPVLLDTDREFLRNTGGSEVPYTLIVNPEGQILDKHVGYNPGDEKELEEKIVALLTK